ncbi:response regulator [Segetibacter koreensis]|uniref:response regulator n=1 Tax=Segetibacter koreensis TaxID=398037 RepID=UPI0003648760|nr:response regulator [Segetibacter koreensis]
MPTSGPIVFIDDDLDDQELYSEAIEQLQLTNQVKFLSDGNEALSYLRTTSDKPFIIFCDINMPVLNGIELRDKINNDENLKRKSIPFIFLTTTATKEVVKQAYFMSVQGFFEKPKSFEEIKSTFRGIIDYWFKCKHPNVF